MIGGMKVKTSVTLSEDVLQRLQEQLGPGGNRSEFIEEAVRQRLRDIRRAERDARDRAIYERMAADAQIQAEVLDNLELAVPWWDLGDEVEVSDEVRKRWEVEGRLRATG